MAQDNVERLVLPSMGEGQVDALITGLYKQPGDPIELDEVIYQVETDKAQVEIESPVAGILVKWLPAVGARVRMGDAVAEVTVAGDDPKPAVLSGSGLSIDEEYPTVLQDGAAAIIPPRTRIYARERGIEESKLAGIQAVTRFLTPNDIDRFLAETHSDCTPSEVTEQEDTVTSSEQVDTLVSERQRQLVAAMHRTRQTTVTSSLSVALDSEKLRAAKSVLSVGCGLITDTQVFVYHVALAMVEHPGLRSTMVNDGLKRTFSRVNIGISVAGSDDELFVAGLNAVSDMTFPDFAAYFNKQTEASRRGASSIGPATTVIVSHLGERVMSGEPLLVAPASAVIFLGGTQHNTRTITMTFDHRLLNGQQAADFLTGVLDLIALSATAKMPASEKSISVSAQTDVGRAVIDAVAEFIGGAVDLSSNISDLGIDSAAVVMIMTELNKTFRVSVSPALMYRSSSLGDLVDQITTKQRESRTSAESARPDRQSRKRDTREDPVAIVGIACRYSGVANAEELWSAIVARTDLTSPIPRDRGWHLDGLFSSDQDSPGKFYAEGGGFLSDIYSFDHTFFGLSVGEATAMDPQQRMTLETSWHALENAGIAAGSLRESDTAVYVGAMSTGYESMVPSHLGEYALTGSHSSVVSGRVAHALGLRGAAVTIDTACSSSLTALHLARRALIGGECSLALAGGVTVMTNPSLLLHFSKMRALSRDGRCKSFSQDADGFALGEGAGIVVLERLSDAQRNGHRVLAVISGSAVNQDGASNGLTAPNGAAQERVMHSALSDAGLVASDVGLIEAHGTGTPLGDAVELLSTSAVYGANRQAERIGLGSVKTNIGHAQAAAGIAGIAKVVAAMKHRLLPPTLHVGEPSDALAWSTTGLVLMEEAREWPDALPCRAAVSGFGISGTNTHIILERS